MKQFSKDPGSSSQEGDALPHIYDEAREEGTALFPARNRAPDPEPPGTGTGAFGPGNTEDHEILRQFIKHTPTAIAMLDAKMCYIQASDRWIQDYGLNWTEIIGKSHYEVFPNLPQRWKDVHQRVLGGAVESCEQEQFIGNDGRVEWLQWEARPWRHAGGEVGGLIFFTRFITERIRSEEAMLRQQTELRILFDLMPALIWFKDTENRILRVNRRAADAAGGTVEAIEGRPTSEIYPAEAAQFYADDLDIIRSGTPKLGYIEPMKGANGEDLWVQTDKVPYCDKDGKVIGIVVMGQDMTARRKLEAEALILGERLATTLESLTEGFFTLDLDWRFGYVNREAERLLRCSRSELLGEVIWTKFPYAAESAVRENYERALREHVTVQFETFYAPLGLWIEVRAFPSRQGLAVYFRDVTGVRQAAEALKASEERFRLLAKATNDAIWDWDLATDTLWWNEGFETLFGYERKDVEPTVLSWTSRIHPSEVESVTASIRRAISLGDEGWSAEYRFRRRDGGYSFVLDRGHIIHGTDGGAVRMIGGMTDLTERKGAEERIAEQAALIDEARDAIFVCDLGYRITFWSKGAERVFGWSAGEAGGQLVHDLLRSDGAVFHLADAVMREEGVWSGKVEHQAKDGSKLWLDSRWTYIKDAAGEPRSILFIDTDITERRRLEQQFLRAQRMESIGTLAGGIAHDLNNSLAPIIMSIDLLKLRFTDEESAELLAVISSSAKRGADMVQQLLSFARGVEGEMTVIRIDRLIRDIEKIANETFLKNVDMRVRLSSGLWNVMGDGTQLHQVLLNLCVNARDAMPLGGPLTITAENTVLEHSGSGIKAGAESGHYVSITVEDSGVGIPREDIDKIFDPFFTTKELGKGTGLGLSTSLAIIKSHGGVISAESTPGKGTRFKVLLPACAELPAARTTPVAEEMSRGNGELILVVDDEVSVRRMTQQTLEAFGFRVLTASDGVEAVALFTQRSGEISAVLTDLMMPVMDGPAAIQAILRIDPHIPIIAVSGLSLSGNEGREDTEGIKYFLQKPYTARALLDTLRRGLTAAAP